MFHTALSSCALLTLYCECKHWMELTTHKENWINARKSSCQGGKTKIHVYSVNKWYNIQTYKLDISDYSILLSKTNNNGLCMSF